MQNTYLGKLQKGRARVSVCVGVLRKWTVNENISDRAPLYVGLGEMPCMLRFRGRSWKKRLPFHMWIKSVIDKFKVNNAKATYKPVNSHLMIEFTDFTTIELSQKSSTRFPAYVYNFTPFDKIVPYQGPVANLTYVLGYIRRYTSLTSRVPKGKERASIPREIFINDIRDDQAVNFTVEHLNTKDNPKAVVGLFVGLIPRKWYSQQNPDKPYVSGSSACQYYLNPDISEARPFYNSSDTTGSQEFVWRHQWSPARIRSVPSKHQLKGSSHKEP